MLEGPYDLGNTDWNRARIAAALGDRAKALRLLRESYRQGLWLWLDGDLHTAPDLRLLRGYRPFEDFVRPKG